MKYDKPHKQFAKKSFGQNFLVDENYIKKIIDEVCPQKDETIVEIGSGRGALTEKLIESGAKVVAIELERDMIAVLKEKFGDQENLTLIESNALKIDFAELLNHKPVKLVANLPYYISTAILQRLIEQRESFLMMILMFQREVVERMTAEIGNSERGFLSVLVQTYLETTMLFEVPPTAFRPAPKVWSAISELIPKKDVFIENESLYRKLISATFLQKRKTIQNNLKNAPSDLRQKFADINESLEKSGVAANRRAETLTIEEWKSLYEFLIPNKTKLNIENVK